MLKKQLEEFFTVRKNEPSVRKNEPSVRKNEPSFRKNEPSVRKNEPSVRKNEPSVRKSKPNNYLIRHVHLTEDQLNDIAAGFSKKEPVRLLINFKRDKTDVQSDHKLPLTKYQIGKINKRQEISLSVRQLEYINKVGGFLPALPAILAAAPLIWNVAKGAYDSYQNKKTNDALVAEKKRHNDAVIAKLNEKSEIEGEGLYMNRKPKVLGGSVKYKKKGRTAKKKGGIAKKKGGTVKKKGGTARKKMALSRKKAEV